MSITIVTGVPGSGKTLYAVAELLRPVVGTDMPATDADGREVKIKRTIYTNINGLLLDHELIDGGDNLGMRDWHRWVKPGDYLAFDEFQKVWPPRPNGSKVPDDIQALDTHRHKGVDFLLICQHLMNVDRHILGLCDRHLHIRRVGNMALAVVYEWDHASRSLLYKNSLTKKPWRYPKDAYKLYRSAELHTKQRRKVPGLVWFILAGLAGAAIAAPTAISRISERMDPTRNTTLASVTSSSKSGRPADAPGQAPAAAAAASAAVPAADPAVAAPGQADQIGGCVYRPARGCLCYTTAGKPIEPAAELCSALAEARPPMAALSLPESNLPALDVALELQSLRGPQRAE